METGEAAYPGPGLSDDQDLAEHKMFAEPAGPVQEFSMTESEADTESLRVVPKRRLVLQFARDKQVDNRSGEDHEVLRAVGEEE